MERVIKQTELTIVFTKEGKIVIPIEEEKYGIFPKYCIGIRDGRNTFYLQTINNENVGYRFLLLSQDFKEQYFRKLTSYSIEQLEEILRTEPDKCTLDLHIARRQLDITKVKRFIDEVVKQQEVNKEVQIR